MWNHKNHRVLEGQLMKPYVAHINFNISFHSNSDDPYEDFVERHSDLAELISEHYGDIEIREDEMEESE